MEQAGMNRAAHIWARVGAVCLALVIVGHALWQGPAPGRGAVREAPPQDYPLAAPDPRLAGLPPLMARPAASRPSPLADAPPRLLGIAGRLPGDAEVLVRLGTGETRTIGLDEEAQGWRAVAVTAQSVTFERDGRRETIVLDADDGQ
jgi:hypothetical protein